MAVYQITYNDAGDNPRTIDLLPGDDGVRVEWRTEINRNVTSTGKYENVVQNTLRFISFEAYFKEAVFHKLETFMSFAQQGQPFAFTKDTAKGQELLSLGASVGDTELYVVDGVTDGFEAGDTILIKQAEGLHWDVVEVESVSVDHFTISDSLTHDYDANTPITWYYYFPGLYLLDTKFDPKRDGAYWNHTFDCVEVR